MAGLKLYQHKVFTKEGWKNYEDYLIGRLRIGDDILVFNPHTEIYEWSPLLGIDFYPNDQVVNLAVLDKSIEFGSSQTWIIDVQYPPDLKLSNKYGLINSNTLSNIDSNRDSFGITWNKHTFYLQAGLIDLDVGIDIQTLTPYKESNFTLTYRNEYISTWSPLTLYHNVLVLTEELILLLGCTHYNPSTSNLTIPYALSNTLITTSPINLVEFKGLPNNNLHDLSSIELISINFTDCYVCIKEIGTSLSLPISIPYSDRHLYEIRNSSLSLPNGLLCNFKVKDINGTLSNEGQVRTFRYRDDNTSVPPTPSPTPFPIDPYDIVTKSMGNIAGGYLQLDNLSNVPSNIKISWLSLIDIPTLEVSWENISDKPTFTTTWDEIERIPTIFPTSWELINNKPSNFPVSWESISNKPDAFTPALHVHYEYANKLHTHTISDLPILDTFIQKGDGISYLDNNIGYLTINDITRELITSLLTDPNSVGGGLNADLLGGSPSSFYTNASNLITGVIGSQRLPLFHGDVYSFIDPTNLILNNTSVIPGTYTRVTVDEKGRVIEGGILTSNDIPDLDASKITTGVINLNRLPLASSITPGIVTLSDSYLDIGFTVPTSDVIKAIYDITQTLISINEKGIPNGVATLDDEGIILSSQLPTSTANIIYVDTLLDLPTNGLNNYIYITRDTEQLYIWEDSNYISINTNTTTQLKTERSISIKGDGTWNVLFDGSQDVTGILTLKDTGVNAGTYTKVTVDTKGRVITGTTLISEDIPIIDGGAF